MIPEDSLTQIRLPVSDKPPFELLSTLLHHLWILLSPHIHFSNEAATALLNESVLSSRLNPQKRSPKAQQGEIPI